VPVCHTDLREKGKQRSPQNAWCVLSTLALQKHCFLGATSLCHLQVAGDRGLRENPNQKQTHIVLAEVRVVGKGVGRALATQCCGVWSGSPSS
jgi:hypothetical protein